MAKGISKIREFAALKGFDVVGKLKRLPDARYGMNDTSHYPVWVDEGGNHYLGSYYDDAYCIITPDGGVY